MNRKNTPPSAARQIAAELGQSSPKGTARLACALSGTKPVATLVNTRMEVPSPSRGRPSYRWVDACYVVRPDGTKEYPPVRVREAWSRCASEGWVFKVVSESEYNAKSEPVGHTPGPWTACPCNARQHYNIESASDGNDLLPVATLRGSDRLANAKLIAAAPELLQACEEALNAMCGPYAHNDDEASPTHDPVMANARRVLRAALNKAAPLA